MRHLLNGLISTCVWIVALFVCALSGFEPDFASMMTGVVVMALIEALRIKDH